MSDVEFHIITFAFCNGVDHARAARLTHVSNLMVKIGCRLGVWLVMRLVSTKCLIDCSKRTEGFWLKKVVGANQANAKGIHSNA